MSETQEAHTGVALCDDWQVCSSVTPEYAWSHLTSHLTLRKELTPWLSLLQSSLESSQHSSSGGNKAACPTPYFPEDPGVHGRFREQEALVGARCITRGKVLGAVEEREEDQRELAPPSRQRSPVRLESLSHLVF